MGNIIFVYDVAGYIWKLLPVQTAIRTERSILKWRCKGSWLCTFAELQAVAVHDHTVVFIIRPHAEFVCCGGRKSGKVITSGFVAYASCNSVIFTSGRVVFVHEIACDSGNLAPADINGTGSPVCYCGLGRHVRGGIEDWRFRICRCSYSLCIDGGAAIFLRVSSEYSAGI